MREETPGGHCDVLIVGAGVAGLGCALELGRAGVRVTLVEARDRLGGRIHTVRPADSPLPIELGAEFLHGRPPELLALLDDGKLESLPALTSPWCSTSEGLRPVRWEADDTDDLFHSLDIRRSPDRTVEDYLAEWTREHADGAAAASSARAFVAGFHAADPALMGERALAHETAATMQEDGETNARIPAGYDGLVAMLQERLASDTTVMTGAWVRSMKWRRGHVTLSVEASGRDAGTGSADGRIRYLHAPMAVVTLPVGVLRASAAHGGLRPDPMPPSHASALERLHMGQARRIVLHFRESLWTRAELRAPGVSEPLDTMDFLRSPGQPVPVWWTAAPVPAPLITGWIGGPRAAAMVGRPDSEVVALALDSLAGALRLPRQLVGAQLIRASTYDWGADRWAHGAYSYAGLDGMEARQALAQPVEDTLYWAGEATHWSGSAGTVHGALASGVRAAREVLRQLER